MIQALAVIGLIVLLMFIFLGIPLIVGGIANITSNDSDGAIIKTFVAVNMILAITLSTIIFNFIDNPEKFGYQKIETEQTMEVNEDE